MLTVVTGADGFVGRALAQRMCATGYPGSVRLIDCTPAPAFGFEVITADLTDPGTLRAALKDADRVIHLAALPGGASEGNPSASRRVNLDLTLDILDTLPVASRFVQASSIAVFGTATATIDDESPCLPVSVYGAHKRMAEIAVADAHRRGADALSIRLPGIVARPGDGGGFKSAFMSAVFGAMHLGIPIELPVGPESTLWLLSAQGCATALLHAAMIPRADRASLTLPALRVTMAMLVAELANATGSDPSLVGYAPEPAIEAHFGRLPPLATSAADSLGFRHDGDIATLVARGLANLEVGT